MSLDLCLEQKTAIEAVRAAATVSRTIQRQMLSSPQQGVTPANTPSGVITKQDRSPVTIADFASQALVCAHLAEVFPNDPVIGEEHSGELRKPANASILSAVADHVRNQRGGTATEADILTWIDHGNTAGPTPKRFWTLDPIDGTKGFLRNGQYAVALALIIDGKVALGALACPNLPVNDPQHIGTADPQAGVLIVAQRGQGTKAFPLWNEADDPKGTDALAERTIHVDGIADPKLVRFCESVESGHSDQGVSASIATQLGITAGPLRMDSQAKYAAVARGDASIYLRLPTAKDYHEKIWDHAAGSIVIEEAGGKVTDIDGKPLDFSQGTTLAANRGIVATNTLIHAQVLKAVQSETSRK